MSNNFSSVKTVDSWTQLTKLQKNYPFSTESIDSIKKYGETRGLKPLVSLLESILVLFKAGTIGPIDVDLDGILGVTSFNDIHWEKNQTLEEEDILSKGIDFNNPESFESKIYGLGCKISNHGTHYEVQLWSGGLLKKFMIIPRIKPDREITFDQISKDREEYFRTFKKMGVNLSVKDRPEITRVKVIKALIKVDQYSDEGISVIADYIVALIRAASSFEEKAGKSSLARSSSERELKTPELKTKF